MDTQLWADTRLWVAEDDHRPLKVETRQHRPNEVGPGAAVLRLAVRTYRYDPGAKVPLPAP